MALFLKIYKKLIHIQRRWRVFQRCKK